MCARKNLQQTDQDVYIVTLIIKIFRALMIIVIAFNLNTRQYNAINVFVNSDIDELIYCKSSNEWKSANELFLLLRALYDLKQSSTLWYKHLFNTFNELELEQVSGIECLFINNYMIVVFFVNDIAVLYYSRNVKQVDQFEQKPFNVYEMRKRNGIEWFLDIRITRDRELHQMSFCQNNYIDRLITKSNINTFYKPSGAPLTHYIQMMKNEKTTAKQEIHTRNIN